MRVKVASQEDAQNLVDAINSLLGEFGNATVYDVKALISEPGTFADTKWGWEHEVNIEIWFGRSGVFLTLPEPVRI